MTTQVYIFVNTGQTMVNILDGYSDHVAHAWRKMGLFGEKKSDLWLLSN